MYDYQCDGNLFGVSGKMQVHFSPTASDVRMKIAMCYGQLHVQ